MKISLTTLMYLLILPLVVAQNHEGIENEWPSNIGYEWTIPPKFDLVYNFDNGLAVVTYNRKVGFIDRNGTFIIQPQFKVAHNFSEGLARAKNFEKRGYGYIDKSGTFVIEPSDEYNYDFVNGLAKFNRNGKFGYIDKEGKILIQPQFDFAGDFSEGYAAVQKDKKYGFINKQGNYIITPQFEYAKKFSEGLAAVVQNGKLGFIDYTGKFILSPQYFTIAGQSEHFGLFKNGLCIVRLLNSTQFVLIDKQGKSISQNFDYISQFSEGLAAVKKNEKLGFIDSQGKLVIALQFDNSTSLFSEGLATVALYGKWVVIDKQANIVVPGQKRTYEFKNGISAAMDNYGKFGFIKLKNFNNTINTFPTPQSNNSANYNQSTNNQSNSNKTKVYGVIIGVSDYSSDLNYEGVRDLTYADRDALKVREFLKSAEGGQVPDSQIKILTNTLATKSNIISACREIFWKSSENDLVFFYFSGHGGVDVFLAHDDIIQISELKDIIYKSKAQRRFCVADACHAGSWDKNSDFAKKRLSPQEIVNRYYEELERSGKGLGLFMASQRNETSIDDSELKQGLFTYYYIEGLKGAADANSDGIVRVNELYTYVRKKVQDRASARWNNSQHPELHGNIDMNMPVGITSY